MVWGVLGETDPSQWASPYYGWVDSEEEEEEE
jgi:hypothetical protein